MSSSLQGPYAMRGHELADEFFTQKIYFSEPSETEEKGQKDEEKGVKKERRASVLTVDKDGVLTRKPRPSLGGFNLPVKTDWNSHATIISTWARDHRDQLFHRVHELAKNDPEKQSEYLKNFHGNCRRLLERHLDSIEKHVMKGNDLMIAKFATILGMQDHTHSEILEAARARLINQDPQFFRPLVDAINTYKKDRKDAVTLVSLEAIEIQYRNAEQRFLALREPLLVLTTEADEFERLIEGKQYNPEAAIDLIKSIESMVVNQYESLTKLHKDATVNQGCVIPRDNREKASQLQIQIRRLVQVLNVAKDGAKTDDLKEVFEDSRASLISLRANLSDLFVNGPLPRKV